MGNCCVKKTNKLQNAVMPESYLPPLPKAVQIKKNINENYKTGIRNQDSIERGFMEDNINNMNNYELSQLSNKEINYCNSIQLSEGDSNHDNYEFTKDIIQNTPVKEYFRRTPRYLNSDDQKMALYRSLMALMKEIQRTGMQYNPNGQRSEEYSYHKRVISKSTRDISLNDSNISSYDRRRKSIFRNSKMNTATLTTKNLTKNKLYTTSNIAKLISELPKNFSNMPDLNGKSPYFYQNKSYIYENKMDKQRGNNIQDNIFRPQIDLSKVQDTKNARNCEAFLKVKEKNNSLINFGLNKENSIKNKFDGIIKFNSPNCEQHLKYNSKELVFETIMKDTKIKQKLHEIMNGDTTSDHKEKILEQYFEEHIINESMTPKIKYDNKLDDDGNGNEEKNCKTSRIHGKIYIFLIKNQIRISQTRMRNLLHL